MGIVVRQSFWNSINSYLGVGLGAFNTMILFPRIFIDDVGFLGEVNTLLAAASLISTFGHFGVPATIITYFPRFNALQKKQFFSLSLLVVGTLSTLLLVGSAIYYWLVSSASLLVAGAMVAVSMLLFEVYASLCRYHQQVIMPTFLNNVFRRLVVFTALLAAYFNEQSNTLFYEFLVGGYLLQLLLMIAYSRKRMPSLTLRFRQLELKPILSYGVLVMLSSGAMLAVSRLDVLMINALLSEEAVTFYTVAFFIGTVVSIPSKSMSISLRPIVSKAWAANDLKLIEQLYQKSAISQMTINGLLFVFIWINIDLVYLILPPNYRSGQWVVYYIAMGELLSGSMGINGMILGILNKQQFNLYSGLGLLVLTVLGNLILIPAIGIEGAAIASMLAVGSYNLIRTYVVKHFFDLTPYTKDYLSMAIILIVLISASTILAIFHYSGMVSILVKNLVFVATSVLLFLFHPALIEFKLILARFRVRYHKKS